MAKLYLIRCECGHEQPVSAHQAGSEVVCECGNKLAVPTLRKLNMLPLAEEAGQADLRSGGAASWGPRHAVSMAGLMVAAALSVWGAYLWLNEPREPQFNRSGHQQVVEELLARGTPTDLWKQWAFNYQSLPSRGFTVINPMGKENATNNYQEKRLYRTVVLAAAAWSVVVAAVAWFAWPKPRA